MAYAAFNADDEELLRDIGGEDEDIFNNPKSTMYTIKSIGITLCVFCPLSIILGIIELCMPNYWDPSQAGAGIWCGIIGLTLGVLCICFSKCKSTCLIFWVYLFSIFSAIFGIILCIVEAISAPLSYTNDYWDYGWFGANGFRLVTHLASLFVACSWTTISIYVFVRFKKFYRQKNPTCSCESNCCFPIGNKYQNQRQMPIMVYTGTMEPPSNIM